MSLDKIDTINLSKVVLTRLTAMDYEKHNENNGYSSEQLIFPVKIQREGKKYVDRISEQELRLLFIEEFKKEYVNLFYSIETPTKSKYSFGKSDEDITSGIDGQSALIDMCVFERISTKYKRVLNIEFKNKNNAYKNIKKDILKLITENTDGVFIHLLKNTDNGSFCNDKNTGVFDKYRESFTSLKEKWNNENKSIQLIIISLKQKTIIHRVLKKDDLRNIESIFFLGNKPNCGNIKNIIGRGWKSQTI